MLAFSLDCIIFVGPLVFAQIPYVYQGLMLGGTQLAELLQHLLTGLMDQTFLRELQRKRERGGRGGERQRDREREKMFIFAEAC